MKVYIAARFDQKERVLEIARQFKERGYHFEADWTLHKAVKPYHENAELSRQYVEEDVAGVRSADIFVLLSSDAGTGMYVELGTAIASNLATGKPSIYVVGDHINRAMFYFHPVVNRRNTIEEVLKEI